MVNSIKKSRRPEIIDKSADDEIIDKSADDVSDDDSDDDFVAPIEETEVTPVLRTRSSRRREIANYNCNHCAFKTNDKQDFEEHISSEHELSRTFKCKECNFKYEGTSEKKLRWHVETSHLNFTPKSNDSADDSPTNKFATQKKFVTQKKLRMSSELTGDEDSDETKSLNDTRDPLDLDDFDKSIGFIDKTVTESDVSCTTDEKSFTDEPLTQLYSCEQCKYETKSKHDLNGHMKNGHKSSMFYCHECKYKGKRLENLAKHIESLHPWTKPKYKTNKTQSKTPKIQKTERKIVETGIDRFANLIPKHSSSHACTFCQEIYEKRSDLIVHMQQTHEGFLNEEQKIQEPKIGDLFTCEDCGKGFRSKFVQKVHIKAHKKAKDGNMDQYYKYYLL